MHAYGVADAETGNVIITFATTGAQTVVFLVRSANPLDGQRSYTVQPGHSLVDTWITESGPYDLSISGPNGFLRRFMGSILLGGTGLELQETYVTSSQTITLSLYNGNAVGVVVLVTDAYTGNGVEVALAPDQTVSRSFPLSATSGWYDLLVTMPAHATFGVQLAGHLENGAGSKTDPMIS